MVIDDSAVQRQYATQLCEQLELTVVAQAENGQDALDQLAMLDTQPELLLVDLEMPVLDGISLIQQLAQSNQFISILIVSSREIALLSSVETMIKAYGLPVVGALQKPLSIEQLQITLDKYANKKPTPPPELNRQAKVVVSVPEIASAIINKQFTTYFQPKILLANGMIKGVETLIRWQHPEKGMIMPNDFIPLAEEHGLIHDITLQVLEMSLEWLQYWHAHGLNLNVAINLSSLSLADLGLVEQIDQRVSNSGITPQSITLEITETAVMADVALSLNSLARLRLKGFGLSIDDYGTGFSSMQQLARIPFTELKIDRSFVDGASDSLQLSNMLSIAIETARKLGLHCVAEGVENADDWVLLKRLGCDTAQGYLAAKPMPGDELIDWIKQNSKRLRDL
ncbi:EAL domain-containing response regulator [Chitinibacter bivalviorum]|uniref:EAL domain-containing response regulator n=2 Tax=Chitinibacter bivalviorum TaxID=2739434 RepID=A0A7H9BN89_9NEIS|nr:EAL domain-containing response regulator [Chitinibacter bivalviorum]